MSDFPALPYPWQQQDWQQCCAQQASSKLPHALLIAGPKGIGKRHFSEALAQYLLCESPVSDLACGKCRACQLNKGGNHPDLMVIQPEDDSKGIKIDQVRKLTEALGKTAQQGGFKVVILDPAEAMNANASNALLKSLEEPQANTLLILISHGASQILPTIKSRCQLRLMAMPRREQVLHWIAPLISGANIAGEVLVDAARGAPLLALALLEGDKLELRTQWFSQFERLTLAQISSLEVAALWQNGDISQSFEWLLAILHSTLRAQLGHIDPQFSALSEALSLRLLAIPSDLLHRYLEKLLQTKKLWLSGANPNKQLMLEELLLDWGALLKASPVHALQR